MAQGWTMGEIDEMDLFYYLRVLTDRANAGQPARRDDEGRAYIDDVWPI